MKKEVQTKEQQEEEIENKSVEIEWTEAGIRSLHELSMMM